MPFRILLVDDSGSFRHAARALLEGEGQDVVGVAATVTEAIARAEQLRPAVALVDITLAAESGFELARRLAELDPAPAVILISTHAEEDFADLIAESPAIGFLPKSELSAEAVLRLLDGAG